MVGRKFSFESTDKSMYFPGIYSKGKYKRREKARDDGWSWWMYSVEEEEWLATIYLCILQRENLKLRQTYFLRTRDVSKGESESEF